MKRFQSALAIVIALLLALSAMPVFALQKSNGNTMSEQVIANSDSVRSDDQHATTSNDDDSYDSSFDLKSSSEWKSWAQGDSRWGYLHLGNSSSTVAEKGCLVTSVTKLAIQSGCKNPDYWNVYNFVTEMNANNGFSGAAMYWARPAELIDGFSSIGWTGIKGSSSSIQSSIIQRVQDGQQLILEITKSNGGNHYFAVDNKLTVANNAVYIMDTTNASNPSANVGILLTSKYSSISGVYAYRGLVSYIDDTPTSIPAAPQNIRIDKSLYSTNESIHLSWDASAGATDYYVYLWNDDIGVQLYAIDNGTNLSFTQAPLGVGNYTFIVRAGNSAGYSNSDAYVRFKVYESANLDDDFYAFIEHQSTGLLMTNQSDNIAGESASGSNRQIWHFIRQSNGSYAIISVYDDSCMDVLGYSLDNGTNVYSYSGGYLGQPNQQFYIYQAYGAYYFIPVHTNGTMALDMSLSTH
ncbi:MAG: RICIN domain-containing protein, partial [Clostridia bacterium]|nr:RICIN domain-containing protein [Clostridia bacterium]